MDFEMFQGNSKNIVISVYDKPNGNRVPLVGADSMKWQLFSESLEAPEAIISKDLSTGITIFQDAVGDYMQVALAATDTANMLGRYYYETEVTDSSGNKETVDTGWITIKKKRIA